MKIKVLFLSFLFLCSLRLQAQNPSESNSFDLGSFRRIRVGNSITVELQKGQKELVRVEVANADRSVVQTKVSEGTLDISIQPGKNILKNVKATVYVTYKTLEGIEAQSSSIITSSAPITGERLLIKATTASTVKLSLQVKALTVDAHTAASLRLDAQAGDIAIKASTAAKIMLAGKAQMLSVVTESAAEVNAYEMLAKKASAKAQTAAQINVNVDAELEARATSSAKITYMSNPSTKLDVKATFGASIKKEDK